MAPARMRLLDVVAMWIVALVKFVRRDNAKWDAGGTINAPWVSSATMASVRKCLSAEKRRISSRWIEMGLSSMWIPETLQQITQGLVPVVAMSKF